MGGFLVDEDLPRSLAGALRGAGYEAVDVRDVGLRSRPDEMVRAHALANGLVVLTGDVEYANVLKFPAHRFGTVIVRLSHDLSARYRVDLILAALRGLTPADLEHCVAIVEPAGLRLRRIAASS